MILFLFPFLKGEDDEAEQISEDKIPEEGDKIEDDGAAEISGAKILNHDIVVLQQPSSFEKKKGSSRICPQKRITRS